MSDPNIPPQKVSNRISPLAVIILVGLVVLAVFAFVKVEGHHVTPTGVAVPLSQKSDRAVMPQQSNVPDTLQPSANTNDASEAQPDTDKEPGGLPAHSGPANTAGGQ